MRIRLSDSATVTARYALVDRPTRGDLCWFQIEQRPNVPILRTHFHLNDLSLLLGGHQPELRTDKCIWTNEGGMVSIEFAVSNGLTKQQLDLEDLQDIVRALKKELSDAPRD